MEERIARLESQFEYIKEDIVDLKAETRQLGQKMDSLRDSMFEFRVEMERSFAKLTTWTLKLTLWGILLYIALASSLLGVMAKGFGWFA